MRMGLSRAGERGVVQAIALPILLPIFLAGHTASQTPPAAQDPESGFRISVDVALVVMPATVTDRQRGFVSNLVEGDFEVYENGVRQHIRLFRNEDIPVTVGLVVDQSTSMLPKLAEVSAAAQTFVRSSNPQDEMFVVNFNEHVSLGLPGAVRFTNNTVELANAIVVRPAGGQTALYDAIAKALVELQAGSRDKKVLIVVSDGGDNASVRNLAQVMELAGQSSAVIYTIGVFDEDDQDRNPSVLKRLARATGGEAFFPRQISEVAPICDRIARDIRHQYTIGYVPTNLTRSGVYRSIRVVAREEGHQLSVRTRTGYIFGGEPRPDSKGSK
ncbi:MAG: VWA domain-containing protein [Bryobacteraceae bacterium]|jgi:Ca-activated chloride channel homolog